LHEAASATANPWVIETLLDADADPAARNRVGKLPCDLIGEDSPAFGTDVHRELKRCARARRRRAK